MNGMTTEKTRRTTQALKLRILSLRNQSKSRRKKQRLNLFKDIVIIYKIDIRLMRMARL